MRWPWERNREPLADPDTDGDDAAEAAEALRRAREALRKAQADSETMRRVTGAINREREQDSFSADIYRTMRRRET